jgi:hypothetical protein
MDSEPSFERGRTLRTNFDVVVASKRILLPRIRRTPNVRAANAVENGVRGSTRTLCVQEETVLMGIHPVEKRLILFIKDLHGEGGP